MSKKTGTPLIDLAPKLFVTVRMIQHALSEWIVPGSPVTTKDFIGTIMSICDNQELIKAMDNIQPIKESYEQIISSRRTS